MQETTVSATSLANPISWVASSIVTPSALRSRTASQHLADELGVEGAGDLVEEHRPRARGEGAGDRDPLLLPAGELVGPVVLAAVEAEAGEQRPRLAPRPRLAASPGARIRPSTTLSITFRWGKRL